MHVLLASKVLFSPLPFFRSGLIIVICLVFCFYVIVGESNPQEVLARFQETQMAQVRAKAEAAAAAANLPSFYNPMSVNAAKLAEQQQKRKLLWSRKAADPSKEAKEVGYLLSSSRLVNIACVASVTSLHKEYNVRSRSLRARPLRLHLFSSG